MLTLGLLQVQIKMFHYLAEEVSEFAGVVYHIEAKTNGCHFEDDIFKCISLDENAWILNNISLKLVPYSPINNMQVFIQIMAWRLPAIIWTNDSLLTYIRHLASIG